MAISINASPQRLEEFKKLQEDDPDNSKLPVGMIQDVKTRWNSTVLMLERACRLRKYIKAWVENNPKERTCYPSLDEWKQINYVIIALNPFLNFTLLVSSSKSVTIDKAWQIYNTLLGHIETLRGSLERKRLPWKKSIYMALGKAEEKLRQYYNRTSEAEAVYNIANVLNPSIKLSIYDTEHFNEHEEGQRPWKAVYRLQFVNYYTKNYARFSKSPAAATSQASNQENQLQEMTPEEELQYQLLRGRQLNNRGGTNDPFAATAPFTPFSEVNKYLTEPEEKLGKMGVLDWWRIHEK